MDCLVKVKQVLIYWYLYKLIVGFSLLLSIYCTVTDLQYTLATLLYIYLTLIVGSISAVYLIFRSIMPFKY